jgi:hypothetical protein
MRHKRLNRSKTTGKDLIMKQRYLKMEFGIMNEEF